MNLEPEILEAIYTNKGNDLKQLCYTNRVLLVFLRHFGCTFCRESLKDLSDLKNSFAENKIKLVFVHMAEDRIADAYLTHYQLDDIEHISDLDMSLYEYFGLQKGTYRQLYGLKVWMRGITLNYGLQTDENLGNFQQMPGVFLIENGSVANSFVHKTAADKPDYLEIAKLSNSNSISNEENA